MKKILTSSAATKKFAASLAKKIIKASSRQLKAKVIALTGDLGSGKTTFVQGFLRALGVKGSITSPTFLIIKLYKLNEPDNYQFVYHIDAYRLHFPKEILTLGFKKIIADPKTTVLIEWADKIKKLLPKNTIWIKFEHGATRSHRKLTFKK